MSAKSLEQKQAARPAKEAAGKLPVRPFEVSGRGEHPPLEMPALEQARALGHDFGRLESPPEGEFDPPVESALQAKLQAAFATDFAVRPVAGLGSGSDSADRAVIQRKLKLTGKSGDVGRALAVINAGLHGYEAEVDGDGDVSLKAKEVNQAP